ncbi:MAG: hypothetical protein O3B01_02680 [Planctomycetota bacterium]|nr:hypothetical protein [Planctomycetota bacterium]
MKTRTNREWKSFHKRWTATRFEKFLIGSVIAHLIVGILVGVPAYIRHQEIQVQKAELDRKIVEKEKAKEEAVKEGEEAVKDMLKEELANDQLKDFYKELVSDFMSQELMDFYWEELLSDLDLELDEFAELFENMEEFEVALAEQKLQELKESLLGKLTEMLQRDHQKTLMEELLAQARQIAQEIAANYQKELGNRIGHPVGDHLKSTVEKEEASALGRLRQAEKELESASSDLNTATARLKKAKEDLGEDAAALKEAQAKEDQKGEAAHKAAVRQKRSELQTAAALTNKAAERIKSAAAQLEFHMPAASEFLKKLESSTVAQSAEHSKISADHANNGEPEKARKEAQSGQHEADRALAGLRRGQAAVQLRIAAELTNKLARETAHQADQVAKLDTDLKAANESGDFKESARVTRELANSGSHAEKAASEVPELEKSLETAGETLKQALEVEGKRSEELGNQSEKEAAVHVGKEETESSQQGGTEEKSPQGVNPKHPVALPKKGEKSEGKAGNSGDLSDERKSAVAGAGEVPAEKEATGSFNAERAVTDDGEKKRIEATDSEPGTKDLNTAEEESELSANKIAEASERIEKSNYKPSLDGAKEDLNDAKRSLQTQNPGHASGKLDSAADKLAELQETITNAQKAIGFGSEKSVGKELLEEIDELRQGNLSEHVRKQFDSMYTERALPMIMQKVGESVDKRLKAELVFSEAFKVELKNELEKIFGEGVTDKVEADVAFAQKAGEKLPHIEKEGADADEQGEHEKAEGEHAEGEHGPHGKGKGSKHVKGVAAGAAKAGEASADQQMPAVVKSGLYPAQAKLASLGDSSEEGREKASALERMGNLKNQLHSGRDGFLGQPGKAGLAAARQRHQSRKQSLARFRGIGDVDAEAYKKIVETIKERGHITGNAFDLKGAEGTIAEVQDEKTLQPAMVYVPESGSAELAESTPDQARKVKDPEFKTNRFGGIPFLHEGTIKVDGDLSDWEGLPSLELLPVAKGGNRGKITPKSMKAWVAYGSAGMWFAVDAVDTSGKLENHVQIPAFWLNDCVEIFLDTLNTKFNKRGEANTHQFFAFPFGHKDDLLASVWEAYIEKSEEFEGARRIPYTQDTAPRVSQKTEKGWTFEMMIPKKLLRKGEIRPGRIIGFNFQLDTGTDVYYYWSANIRIISSLHPDTWGDIQFLGSDAKVAVLSKDDEEQQSIIPGSPLRIQITDPDMNLADLVKDKVSATLRTEGGDMETLILEETGFKTGVFEGTIATRLNIGGSRQGLLEIFEGEQVGIEYIDQAQSYGERNVPVKTEVRVGSIGLRLGEGRTLHRVEH